jgi:hypothetical protein
LPVLFQEVYCRGNVVVLFIKEIRDVSLNGKEFTISTCQQLAVERSLM